MSLVWPAGLMFLLALPLIVWLHSRRRRERRVVVPSVTPWLALRAAIPPRRRRIPASLLLFIHLTFATLLALAIASPVLPGVMRSVRDRVVVLDTTTSMTAGDRWSAAQDRASALIAETLGEVTLVALGPRPEVLLARETNRDRASAALAATAPGGTGADLEGSLALAAAAAGPDAEIVVVTDGGIAVPPGARADRWELVGDKAANVAIEAAGVESAGGRGQLFVRIAAFGEEPVSVPLSLVLDGREADRLDALVGADGSFETVWTVPLDASMARVSVEASDALAADDVLQIPLDPEVLRVEMVGQSDAVARALSAMPHVVLTTAGPGTYRTDGTVDTTVFVGVAPDDLPPGGVLVFDPPSGRWSEPGAGAEHIIAAVRSGHPLTDGLDVAGARIASATSLSVPDGAAAVLVADGDAVAFAGVEDGSRLVVFGFDPDGGDLASRLAFPLLVARSVEWAAPQRPPRVVAAGAVVPLPPGSHEVRGPGVSERRVRDAFETTGRPGLYSATSTRGTEPRVLRFGVGAGDASESDLSSDAPPPDLDQVATGGGGVAADGRPLWPWLVAAALVVALGETLWRGARR